MAGQQQGIIGFEGLRVTCVVGVHPHERHTPQEILIDLKVTTDFASSAMNDQITDTVDYTHLAQICLKQAVEGHFQLLETMADRILTTLFSQYPIQWAWLRLRKPSAIPGALCAYIELERSRIET